MRNGEIPITCSNAPCPNRAYNSSTNHLTTSPSNYDAAGNVIQDASNSYTWDAESNLTSINGTSIAMTLNAFGQRVYRTGGTRSYWLDPQGQLLGAWWSAGWNAAIPFGGRKLGMYASLTNEPAGWRRLRFLKSAISRRDLLERAAQSRRSMGRSDASCKK